MQAIIEFYQYADGLIWLFLLLAPFLFLQRRLHFELQAVFLLLTRSERLALGLFSLLFLPGVLLHETSHYLTARILGVQTGRFSLLPQVLPEGKLQLGFVETAQADFLREALIGAAPLVIGGLAIGSIGLHQLGLLPLANAFAGQDWPNFWPLLLSLPQQPDFWLWFYLAFAISTTMLPSHSDRRGWLPLALVTGGLGVAALLAGAGPWMLENLAPWLNNGLRALAVVFGISFAIHLTLWPPLRVIRASISHLTGMKVV